MFTNKQMNCPIYGPVLLVCIYNKYGNILTHDYFYQIFGQYGQVTRILIFEKAKVWKAFIEFTTTASAKNALVNLNNHVVFEDGSKLNIFSSKLQQIELQNCNLGGVNYEELKNEEMMKEQQGQGVRGRRSTLEEYPTHFSEPFTYNYQSNSTYYHRSGDFESTFSRSDSKRASFQEKSRNTFDIDEQFLEIARESQEFRQFEKEAINRKKSKTIVTNPNLYQFVLENSPSKVLFVRSLPESYTNKVLYNIFSNFGNVLRVIYIKSKTSGLIEFETEEQAIRAKDEINYAKPQMKIFYSHYQTLSLREKQTQEDFEQYKSFNSKTTTNDKKNRNPPSGTLYLTLAAPNQQAEIIQLCEELNCPVIDIQWRENGKDKWMCLINFGTIDKSLLVMGFLQNYKLKNGRILKISFTRSKIRKMNQQQIHVNEMSSC